ncbi:hypothetical protein ACIBIZ_27505 [Nonomuraea spiralis]|uniref:hypothetical protein n=1 Tax=Nonomuraea spiralis TaxID=46182 RepID=UPI0037B57855
MRARPGSLALLLSGPVLVAAYAAVNHAAISTASRAAGGRITSGGLTALGADLWWVVKGVALVAGLAAAGLAVVGVLLRRRGRGRSPLLVLSGVLVVPYALGVAVALYNPVPRLAAFYRSPAFADALPPWQAGSALLLLAAALAQVVGAVRTAARAHGAASPSAR